MALTKVFRVSNEFSAPYSVATKYNLDLNLNKMVNNCNEIIDAVESLEKQIFLCNPLNFGYFLSNNALGEIIYSKVTDAYIEDNTILGAKIINQSINGGKILPAALDEIKIQRNTLESQHLLNEAVNTDKMGLNIIREKHLQAKVISNAALAPYSCTEQDIATNAISGAHLKNNILNNNSLQEKIFTTFYFDNNCVSTNHIKPLSIQNSLIADKSVTTSKIKDNAINFGSIKVQNNILQNQHFVQNFSFGSAFFSNDAIITRCLAPRSITTEKFAEKCITTQKLANGAVSVSAKIPTQQLITRHFNTKVFTAPFFAPYSVLSSHIAPQSVTAQKILNSQITIPLLSEEVIQLITASDDYPFSREVVQKTVGTQENIFTIESKRWKYGLVQETKTQIFKRLLPDLFCNLLGYFIIETMKPFTEEDYGAVGGGWVDNTKCFLKIEYPGTNFLPKEIELSAPQDKIITNPETETMTFALAYNASITPPDDATEQEKKIIRETGYDITLTASEFCQITFLMLQ